MQNRTEQELAALLLTVDGQGRAVKTEALKELLDRKDGQILRLVEAGNVLFNRYDPGPIPAEQPTEADLEMAEWDVAVHETNCSALDEVNKLKNHLAERFGQFACTEQRLATEIAYLQVDQRRFEHICHLPVQDRLNLVVRTSPSQEGEPGFDFRSAVDDSMKDQAVKLPPNVEELKSHLETLKIGLSSVYSLLNGVKMIHELENETDAVALALDVKPARHKVRQKLVNDAMAIAEELSSQVGLKLPIP